MLEGERLVPVATELATDAPQGLPWTLDTPEACCDTHRDGVYVLPWESRARARCCDQNDCGPCCADCPTCPTLRDVDERRRATALDLAALDDEQLLAAVGDALRRHDATIASAADVLRQQTAALERVAELLPDTYAWHAAQIRAAVAALGGLGREPSA